MMIAPIRLRHQLILLNRESLNPKFLIQPQKILQFLYNSLEGIWYGVTFKNFKDSF